MSGRLTFICLLEANLALSCVPSARRDCCGSLSQSGPRGGQPSQQSRLELGLRLSD